MTAQHNELASFHRYISYIKSAMLTACLISEVHGGELIRSASDVSHLLPRRVAGENPPRVNVTAYDNAVESCFIG